jgi:hypothetical protein
MTKQEAIQAMLEGKKVRHRYFTHDEWMTINRAGQILLEDGVAVQQWLFWRDRTGVGWEDGYTLLNSDKNDERSATQQKPNSSTETLPPNSDGLQAQNQGQLKEDVEVLAEEAMIKAINSFTWAGGGVREKFRQGFVAGFNAGAAKWNNVAPFRNEK